MATFSLVKAFKKSIRPVVIGLASMFTANGAIADNPSSVTEPTGKIYASPATQALFGPVIWEGVEKISPYLQLSNDIIVTNKKEIYPSVIGTLSGAHINKANNNIVRLISELTEKKYDRAKLLNGLKIGKGWLAKVIHGDYAAISILDIDDDGLDDLAIINVDSIMKNEEYLAKETANIHTTAKFTKNIPNAYSQRLLSLLHEIGHLYAQPKALLGDVTLLDAADEITSDQLSFDLFEEIANSTPHIYNPDYMPDRRALENFRLQRAVSVFGQIAITSHTTFFALNDYQINHCSSVLDQISGHCDFEYGHPDITAAQQINGMRETTLLANYLLMRSSPEDQNALNENINDCVALRLEGDCFRNAMYVTSLLTTDRKIEAIAALQANIDAGIITEDMPEFHYVRVLNEYFDFHGVNLMKDDKYFNAYEDETMLINFYLNHSNGQFGQFQQAFTP